LLGILGARNQSRQQGFENQQRQDDLDERRQEAQDRLQLEREQFAMQRDAARQRQIAENRANGLGPDGNPLPAPSLAGALSQIVPNNRGFAGGIDPTTNKPRIDPVTGKPYTTTPPGMLADFFRRRADFYLQQSITQGRPDLANAAREYETLASQTDLSAQREGAAALSGGRLTDLVKGKIPLEQAQADWWRHRVSGTQAELNNRLAIAKQRGDSALEARVAGARISASASLSRMQASNEEREFIMTATALNAANGRNATEAFQEAMAQYHQAAQAWSLQKRQFDAGLTTTDPGSAPTPQQFTVNMAPPQAAATTVQIIMPDGSVRSAPAITQRPAIDANVVAQYVSAANTRLHRGETLQQVKTGLDASVAAGRISQATRDAIVNKLPLDIPGKHSASTPSGQIQGLQLGFPPIPGQGSATLGFPPIR
jgi:hypothetical protein